jgi:hypothetical protein
VNIYQWLVHEFYMNVKANVHYDTPHVDTKVCNTRLRITFEVISEVTGIPFFPAFSTPFPDTVAKPPREELMARLNPSGEYEWEEHRNKILISYLQTPERLLARIVMQNILPISRHIDVPLDRAQLIFAIINRVPFCCASTW